VNNKELQAELSKKLGITQKDTAAYLNAFVEEINVRLTEGNQVAFLGVGVLEVRKRESRVFVNPATQQSILVPQRLTPAFRVTSTFKDKLKNYPQS